MSMLSLGMAEEFKHYGIRANCLWPKTIIATAAIEFAIGNSEMMRHCRTPAIVADAAYEILSSDDPALTGQCLIDETLLRARGVSEFDRYAVDPDFADQLHPDLFL